MKIKSFGSIVGLALALVTTQARAAVYDPFGPQNDVSLSTVLSGGWTMIYQGAYSDFVTVATMFSGADTYVMLGAMRTGSSIIDVLAATTLADLQTYTPQNVSHLSNGSQWYYNGGSFGFAGATDTILQYSADINGQDERDRLSWHASDGYGTTPTQVIFGWRAGNNVNLNSSSDWQRVVFTTHSLTAAIPEPSTWAMMILGFTGVGYMAYRRKRQAPALA